MASVVSMVHEHIPDALPGAAPTLDHSFFQHRVGRLVPSEGGESAHSVAVTTLTNKSLKGVPIAQRVGDKQFRYYDTDGNVISKQQAMELAGGVVYYQELADPSKGRLRLRGSFVGEPQARSIVSGSCASSAAPSDVADLRSLPQVEEEEEEEENADSFDGEASGSRSRKNMDHPFRHGGHVACSFIVLVWILTLSGSPSKQVMVHEADMVTTSGHASGFGLSLSPDIVQLLEADRRRGLSQSLDKDFALSPEIVQLLEADEKESEPRGSDNTNQDDHTTEDRKSLAFAEVDRILASRQVSEILGAGPKRQQQQEFHRIVNLLHPDKGIVSTDDERASLALRLTFAARRRASKPRT